MSSLRELMDDRGWAEGALSKEDATFSWMKEATAEIERLKREVMDHLESEIQELTRAVESLSRTLASRTDHLV